MKAGKAAGLDGCAVECLKSGGTSVIEWLVRLLNVYFVTSRLEECMCSSLIQYKGKCDKYECICFMGISLLNLV